MASAAVPGSLGNGSSRHSTPAPVSGAPAFGSKGVPFAPVLPKFSIVVIGSPEPEQKYPYEFVSAADCRPKNSSTVWLIERSGYEAYGVSLDYITKLAPPGGYGWITPQNHLVGWINSFVRGPQIKSLTIFSHGLRELVALRYGWDKLPDYGLRSDEVKYIDPKAFQPLPSIEFDSCNSGVADSGGGTSIAQAVADRIHTAVGGWTGRTSYADVNSGATCVVRGSNLSPNPFRSEMYRELYSRYKAGTDSQYKVFQPQ